MEEAKKERLKAEGVNLAAALERFMNNEVLYNNFLRKFAANTEFEDLENAFSKEDYREALEISHKLKGSTGSLGFTRLYDLLCEQVTLLRKDDNASAAALLKEILPEYRRMLAVVKELI